MEALDAFTGGKNPYQVLELDKGPDSTDAEIKKAYRRLALLKHPDKLKNKAGHADAAAEFHQLKEAYAVLTDKDARAALNDLLRAQALREERYAAQSSKRQKLREELDRREQQHAAQRSEEELARSRLKEELAALRARAAAEAASRQAAAADAARRASGAAATTSSAKGTSPAPAAPDEATQLLMQTVKVSWDPTVSGYTTERIRQLFAAQPGLAVEDVVHKEPKHKKKGKASALVVLGSVTQVTAATQLVLGDATNPLLILPYYKVVPGAAAAGGGTPPGTLPHPTSSAANVAGTAGAAAAAIAGGTGPGRPVPSKPLFPVMAAARPAPKPTAPLFPVAAGVGVAQHPLGSAASQPAAAAAAAAQRGAAAVNGSFSSFPGGAGFNSFPGFPSAAPAAAAATVPGGAAAAVAGAGAPGADSYEGSVLAKMQQRAAERQRLVEQLKAEEQAVEAEAEEGR